MAQSIDATSSTEEIANQLQAAVDELGTIAERNNKLRQEFENEKWSGLDQITDAGSKLSQAQDSLVAVAEKIGVGGQIIREARQKNQMAGTKESLGRT